MSPGGAAEAPDGGRVATAAEKSAAGLDPTSQAWGDGKGKVGALPTGLAPARSVQPDNGLYGPDYLKSLPQACQAQLQPFIDGREVLPTGRAAQTPAGQQLLNDLSRADPQIDLADAAARVKTRVAFTSGKPAAIITSINTAVNHLGQLYDSIDKMGNGDFTPGNAFMHAVTPVFGNTSYRDFQAAAARAAPEVASALKAGYATEPDIKAVADQFKAEASPAQLKETIRNMIEGIGGRLDPLTEQYNQGMGTTKGRFDLLKAAREQLSPASRAAARQHPPALRSVAPRTPRTSRPRAPVI